MKLKKIMVARHLLHDSCHRHLPKIKLKKFTTASVPSTYTPGNGKYSKDSLNTQLAGRFDIQAIDSGSLFKSGPDLDAMQRGNVEMAYLSLSTHC